MAPGAPCQTSRLTGMAQSVMAEVARMLETLASEGKTGAIDLRSLPLTDADRQQLEAALGRGEVSAELVLAGRSSVWETAYHGAWWIRHRGAEDKISSEEIAVCPVPEILVTHAADIDSAATRLRRVLDGDVAAHAPPTSQAEAFDG
jgi:hydrogenase-1 operon protein HyaF